MKKIIILLAIGLSSSLIATAQVFSNADFSNFTTFPGAPNGEGYFNDWTSTGSGAFSSTTINGGADICAKMEAKAEIPTSMYCSNPNKPETCYPQQTGPTSIQIGGLQQTFLPTLLPAKLEGKVNFRATYSSPDVNINGAVLLEGSFNGYAILDTLLFDSGKSGSFSLNINPKLDPNCKVNKCSNYLTVKILSCFGSNCDGQLQGRGLAGGTNSAILYIDDLSFTGSNALGIFSKEAEELNVYPNPTSDFIHVAHFSEVLDLQGNKVAEGVDEIDLSALPKGMYIVRSANQATKINKL